VQGNPFGDRHRGVKDRALANPLNDDAAAVDAFETQLKFDKVILRTNLGLEGFRAALAELSRKASGADFGVVYFAGHGTEVGGCNFLIPVDATLLRPAPSTWRGSRSSGRTLPPRRSPHPGAASARLERAGTDARPNGFVCPIGPSGPIGARRHTQQPCRRTVPMHLYLRGQEPCPACNLAAGGSLAPDCANSASPPEARRPSVASPGCDRHDGPPSRLEGSHRIGAG
jgi:hypothetical protein